MENSSADLLRFPPWAGDPGQRYRSTPFHDKSFNDSSAQGNDLPFRIARRNARIFRGGRHLRRYPLPPATEPRIVLDMTAFAGRSDQPAGLAQREKNVRHLSAAFHKKPVERSQARDASLDLQGRHPHLWSSSGLGLGSWNFSCRVPQFRIFYTTFFCERSPQRLCAVAGRDGTLGFDTMVWFPTFVHRHPQRKTAKWPTELTGAPTLASSLGVIGILLQPR